MSMAHDNTPTTVHPSWCAVDHTADQLGEDVEHLADPVTFALSDSDTNVTLRMTRYDEFSVAGEVVDSKMYVEMTVRDEESTWPDGTPIHSWTRMTTTAAHDLLRNLIIVTAGTTNEELVHRGAEGGAR